MDLRYTDILIDLAHRIGLDAAAFVATEEIVADEHVIGFQLEGHERVGDLLLSTVLGTPDAERFDAVARVLLEADHFWTGTDGCTLGLQRDTGAVTLCARIALCELDGETLTRMLDGFIDTASFWRGFVEGTIDVTADVLAARAHAQSRRREPT